MSAVNKIFVAINVGLMGAEIAKTTKSAIESPRNVFPTFFNTVWMSRNSVVFYSTHNRDELLFEPDHPGIIFDGSPAKSYPCGNYTR